MNTLWPPAWCQFLSVLPGNLAHHSDVVARVPDAGRCRARVVCCVCWRVGKWRIMPSWETKLLGARSGDGRTDVDWSCYLGRRLHGKQWTRCSHGRISHVLGERWRHLQRAYRSHRAMCNDGTTSVGGTTLRERLRGCVFGGLAGRRWRIPWMPRRAAWISP
ncbi:hypothetical protein H310_10517 [Aphanomyces invadans]|uniref:Uncharacterized protein n=1 Tax=Aphanomyces invadans TaxID=157072 RepID=A0A024TQQ9_9STRA|nr:hypothetical protein H310_10517 [Aphanomyces invadans]ETV96358.1 hypothetical protein H310_10517 [Aphanomyces invadans]|eukprot:XP_008875150.1 hypothetical protein H310_10517 [Aphanomyces invadans]